jgi:succinyl-CoA synthetase beta subunit
MNLHEYQAKQLLSREGVAVPDAGVACTPEEARSVAERLLTQGCQRVVLKSQIHAGGRGKGTFRNGVSGGVKVLSSVEEVMPRAQEMLGQVLVTRQTGPEGRRVNRLLVEGAREIRKEFYLAVLLDRRVSRPLVMASTEGGMDIEEVAARSPRKIIKEWVDPALGLMPYQARKVASALRLKGELIGPAAKLLIGAYNTWWNCDASLVEINPLCVVAGPDGKDSLVALDAKMSLDDNALFRHPDLAEMRDLNEEAPLETEASRHGLNYIKLDGNIACLVNGAGLAMATMDIIQHYGGKPANFLDVGGGASQEQVTAAFRIILSDPNVRAILVNIFGGIMQCDIIAAGIIAAARETHLQLPLVVRLEGNNVEVGAKILADSGLPIIRGDSMADAAEKVVRAVPPPSG